MLSNAFWVDVVEKILASLEIPQWETIASMLKGLLELEGPHILDEWCDDTLDELLGKIIDRAARLGTDRDALEAWLSPLRASLRLTLRTVLDRNPMGKRTWHRLLRRYGDTPVGTLPLRVFFTSSTSTDRGTELSHWADTARDAAVVRGIRYVFMYLMFGRAVPFHAAIAGWGHYRLRWEPDALYRAVAHVPLGDVWERQSRLIAAEIGLPKSLVQQHFDAVTRWMGWRLGNVTAPYVWEGFHHELSDLLAGQTDPKRVLEDADLRARFEELRRKSRAEAADLYRNLADRRLGDTRFADYLLAESLVTPADQVLCWNLVARGRVIALL